MALPPQQGGRNGMGAGPYGAPQPQPGIANQLGGMLGAAAVGGTPLGSPGGVGTSRQALSAPADPNATWQGVFGPNAPSAAIAPTGWQPPAPAPQAPPPMAPSGPTNPYGPQSAPPTINATGTTTNPVYGWKSPSGYNPAHMEDLQKNGVQGGLRNTFGRGFTASDQGRGLLDLAEQFKDDPAGYEAAVANRKLYETGGWNPHANSAAYQLGGNAEWVGNRVGQMDAAAAAMGQPSRYQPGIDMAGMYQAGAAGQIAGVGRQFGGVANQIGGAATGAGYAGQMNAANALYAMGQQPQGMSASEMAMRTQAGQALQGNAALAAGARGANAGLGMRNAAMGNAAIQGNLVSQLGQQRANEDLAYRTQRMQALGAGGQAYGQAMGSQVDALGQQANVLGGQGQMYGQAGQMAGQAGEMALRGAQLELTRDDAARQYLGMGQQIAQTDMGSKIAYDSARTGNYLTHYGIDKAGIDAKAARDSQFANNLIGGAFTAAGAVAGGLMGGPGGAAAGGAGGNALGQGITAGMRK